jgi:hypothetical protein
VIKKDAKKVLKYADLAIPWNTAHVECKNESNTSNDRGEIEPSQNQSENT